MDAAGATTAIGNEKTISTYMGNVWSPLGWKNTYSVNYKEVFIIWDDGTGGGVKNSNYSTQKWQAVVAHEIGHALGYEGHTDQFSLMYWDISDYWAENYNTPSSDNLNHLEQMY